ncbi:MAG: ATP-binding protein [Verrucomicrobiota bacterium JB022]|nr:ATP-binding protein [Verrucomicrobiota bacterium JB022]
MRWNLLGPLILISVLLTIPGFWVVNRVLTSQLKNEMALRGDFLVHALATAAGTMSVPENFSSFVDTTGEVQDVRLILIVRGQDGMIVGGTRPEWVGVKVRDLPPGAVSDALGAAERSGWVASSVYLPERRLEYVEPVELIQPDAIIGPEGGAVILQLDTASLEAGAARIVRVVGVGRTILFLVVMLWLAGHLERTLISPISQVVRTVRRQAGGDPSARVDLTRKDELGELGSNLNRMLTTLNEQTEVAQRSAARFLTVFEHSTSGIVLLDQVEIFDSNRAALLLLRCERKSNLSGQAWANLAPEFQPDGRASHDKFRELMELARVQGSCRSECLLQRMDGSSFVADATLTSIYIDERDGFLLMFHDITPYKEAQAELRRSKAAVEQALRELSRHKYALDQHAIVAVTDANGVITYANELFCEHSGFRQDELLGQTHALLKSGVHPPEFYIGMWNVIAAGNVWRGEICNRAKDGRLHWMQCTIVPFKDADGRIDRYVAIRSDITERKEAEAVMRKAKEAAEAADRAKSVFLATMSHEIRTPMNGVIGMAQLLSRTPLSEEQREFVRTIEVCGTSLISLINDILDFSKIEAGKLELEAVTFDVRQCVEESLDLVVPLAVEKGLELALIFDPRVPPAVVGDMNRMRQVLFNLLSNAIKFTQEGEVVVRIWTEADLRDADHVRLHCAVSDTGIGIPRDRRDRLFRPFSQIDAGTARQYGGTGLGLAICDRLVRMMEGSIQVESEEGRGATFSFDVRVRRVAGFRAPVLDLGRASGLRWNIAEPNLAQRESLRMILEPVGLNYGFYSNLPEVLAEDEAWLLERCLAEKNIRHVYRENHDARQAKVAYIGYFKPGLQISPREIMIQKPFKAGHVLNSLRRLAEDGGATGGLPSERTAHDAAPALASLRVLVADDNQVNQKVISLMLRRRGCEASVVSNGREVLERLEQDSFDVLLLDVQMPVLDGYETAALLRRDPRWAELPIIAVTAGAMKGDREKAIEAGMDDYLAKPITEESLGKVLERVLG